MFEEVGLVVPVVLSLFSLLCSSIAWKWCVSELRYIVYVDRALCIISLLKKIIELVRIFVGYVVAF